MKKTWLFCAVLLAAGALLGAQEARSFSLALGMEGNMNTRTTAAAAGGSLATFFGLNRRFTLGLKGGVSHNLEDIMVVEPEAFFRCYAVPLGEAIIFFQADLGASLIFERGKLFPAPLGGLSAGIRFPLGPLFLEPSIRGGYPFIGGLGIAAIFRFGS
jgi:hypothetical protein